VLVLHLVIDSTVLLSRELYQLKLHKFEPMVQSYHYGTKWTPDLRSRQVNRCGIGVRAAIVSLTATNKISVAWIRDLGVRASFPGGDVDAAMAPPRRAFVLPDSLLPWRRGSGSARESGGRCTGDGRRRAPASSRWLLPWSRERGVKAVALVFFLDCVDGGQQGQDLRSDGFSSRPTSPIGDGVAACGRLLLRSTKEQVSDGISSDLGLGLHLLPPLRRKRRRLGIGCCVMCSRTWRDLVVIFCFLGVLCAFSWVCCPLDCSRDGPRVMYSIFI
jgi:hypothetical protein